MKNGLELIPLDNYWRSSSEFVSWLSQEGLPILNKALDFDLSQEDLIHGLDDIYLIANKQGTNQKVFVISFIDEVNISNLVIDISSCCPDEIIILLTPECYESSKMVFDWLTKYILLPIRLLYIRLYNAGDGIVAIDFADNLNNR